LEKNLSTAEQRLRQIDIAVTAEHSAFASERTFVHPCADRQRDLDMLGISWRRFAARRR
jgi:hypothetical protein